MIKVTEIYEYSYVLEWNERMAESCFIILTAIKIKVKCIKSLFLASSCALCKEYILWKEAAEV